MNTDFDSAIASLKKGDIKPSLIAALTHVVEGWRDDPSKLRGLSVRDTVSLINTLVQAQKLETSTKTGGDAEDVFKARLRVVSGDG